MHRWAWGSALLADSLCQGDIISDHELISNLETTKETADDIAKKAALAATTQESIAKAREFYRPVAIRASLMFFLIDRLVSLDHMYQFSLHMFSSLFVSAIKSAPGAEDPADRLENVCPKAPRRRC